MLNLCFPKTNLTVWCQYFNTYNYIYMYVYVFIEIYVALWRSHTPTYNALLDARATKQTC